MKKGKQAINKKEIQDNGEIMSQNDKEPKHLRVIAEPEEKGWTTEEEGIWENKCN